MIEPLNHRAMYNETMKMWTWHRILRAPIKSAKIYREKPDGFGGRKVEYLQLDKSWSSSSYSFAGDEDGGLPEHTWTDFSFETNFNILGQWNFFCEVELSGTGEIRRHATAVMCESISALRSFPLPNSINDGTGIFFNADGYLCVRRSANAPSQTETDDYVAFHLARDTYYVESSSIAAATLYTFDEYKGGLTIVHS
jgi:hypothetical protein